MFRSRCCRYRNTKNRRSTRNIAGMTKLTKTKRGRVFSHAVIAFVSVLIPALVLTNAATLKASALAALPAAFGALFAATA